MKILVKAFFGDYERVFEISCGNGEGKTFKWLGNVVCQRFALAAPNGTLRHRDHFRGITESAQHAPTEIILSTGQIPHPAAILADFLRDGDTVELRLISRLDVDSVSGCAKHSKWSVVAFGTNSMRSAADEEENSDSLTSDSASLVQIRAKSDFMRLVLSSQMINQPRIEHAVNSNWSAVNTAMPHLKESDSASIKAIFYDHWCVLLELFRYFAPDGTMNLENFKKFMEYIELFSARGAVVIPRIHRRACRALDCTALNPSGLMVAIILASQFRHNDTFEQDSEIESPADGVKEIFECNIFPSAERLCLSAVVTRAFCSDEVLAGIRDFHNDMFAAFEKYASRSHTLPTSLKNENMAECLFHAGLISDKSVAKSQALFREVRNGLVGGRGRINPMLEESKYDESTPDDEFIFPEFVEAAARAGFYKYFKAAMISEAAGGGGSEAEEEPRITVEASLLKGVQAAAATLNFKEERNRKLP